MEGTGQDTLAKAQGNHPHLLTTAASSLFSLSCQVIRFLWVSYFEAGAPDVVGGGGVSACGQAGAFPLPLWLELELWSWKEGFDHWDPGVLAMENPKTATRAHGSQAKPKTTSSPHCISKPVPAAPLLGLQVQRSEVAPGSRCAPWGGGRATRILAGGFPCLVRLQKVNSLTVMGSWRETFLAPGLTTERVWSVMMQSLLSGRGAMYTEMLGWQQGKLLSLGKCTCVH